MTAQGCESGDKVLMRVPWRWGEGEGSSVEVRDLLSGGGVGKKLEDEKVRRRW